jgi:hypothetical protein
MRRLTKQFELSSQCCDTLIRLGAREVGLKCVQLVSGFRQPLQCRSLLGRHWLVIGHRPLVRARIAPVNPTRRASLARAPATYPRRGQYRQETLIARFGGDVLMPDVRHLIAECPAEGRAGPSERGVLRGSARAIVTEVRCLVGRATLDYGLGGPS